MKILGIKFKNISSLLGEWEIRFDRPPLSDTRLFAIVGANGSGKSSILDALTLALYGETSRLRNPESEIMHRLANDSYAEVTFSVGEEHYCSRWSVRKVNGRMESPEMSLASINGGTTVLEDRTIKVRNRIAELTGLDFKRFCCSILLAQGEYTAFLNALENERAEILERIVGPEIAQELEEKVSSKARVETERLLQLKETAESFPFPDKGRLDQVRQSYEQTTEEIQEIDRALEELRIQEDWWRRLERLEAEELDSGELLAEAEARYARTQAALHDLERARSVAPLEEGLRDLDRLEAEGEAIRSQVQELEEGLSPTEARLRELEEGLRQSRTDLEKARERVEDRADELQDALQRDREIAAESDRFLEGASGYEAVERSQKENLQRRTGVANRIAELENREAELHRWLQAHTADGDLQDEIPAITDGLKELDAIRRELAEYEAQRVDARKAEGLAAEELQQAERAAWKVRSRVDLLEMRKADRDRNLKELLGESTVESFSADLRTRKAKLAAYKKLLKIGRKYRKLSVDEDPRDALARIGAEQSTLSQALTREKAALSEFDEQVRWRDALRKYTPYRSALRSGAPCPLCGATDHPYVKEGLPDFTDLDHAVQDREQKIKALQKELEALDAKSATIKPLAEAAGTLQQRWVKISSEVGGEWAISHVDLVADEILRLKAEMKDTKSRIRGARWQKWRSERIGRAIRKKMQGLTGKEQIRDMVRRNHESQRGALDNLEGEIQRLKEREEATRSELAARLERCGERASKPGAEMELGQRVRIRYEDYRRRSEEYAALMDQLRSLRTNREVLLDEHRRLQEQGEMLAAQVETAQRRLAVLKAEREAVYGDLDPAAERQVLEDELELRTAEEAAISREIEVLRQRFGEDQDMLERLRDQARGVQAELEDVERRLLAQSAASGLGSLEEAGKLLLVLQDEQGIVERHGVAEKTLEEAKSQALEARTALESTRSEEVSRDSLETIHRKISEKIKQRDDLQQEIRDAERLMREQADAEREYRNILQAIALQEKICAEATAEQKKLQSQNGGGSRKALHRLMLERLIEQTNRHMAALSGRYSLQPTADDGLGIHIEDSLQGGICRSIKTLSGGETFLVSLSLALGLADMASTHRKIESLFLDEGFGALDEEMIFTALSALKTLRDNGKFVGVISHVKRLADEIPTQVRVEKEPGGSSRITIVE